MSLQSDFEAKFPEFVPLDQTIFDNAVEMYPCIYGAQYCESNCNQCQLCDNQIILYLIAHLYWIDSRTFGGNPSQSPVNNVSSKTVRDESVSFQYGDTDNNTLFFNTSKYGQRYLILTQKNAVGGYFV